MYYLIFPLFFFFVCTIFLYEDKPTKAPFLFLFFSIILFWGISYIYAADTDSYIEIFYQDIHPVSDGLMLSRFSRQYEVGYTLLAQVCKTITPHYWFFQLLVFSFEICLFIKGIVRLFERREAIIIIPLLFFFFPSMLGAFRQGIAIAFFIYALPMINEQRPWRYLIWILIASLFHQSALLLIIVFVSKYLNKVLSKDWLVIAILLVCDGVFIFLPKFTFDTDSIISLLGNETLEMGVKYSRYLEGYYEEGAKDFGILKVLEVNAAVILFTYFGKKNGSVNLMRFNLILFVLISFIIRGFFAHRLNYYFDFIYDICLIQGVLGMFNHKRDIIFGYWALAIYFIWFFVFKCDYISFDYRFVFGF